MSQTCLVVKDHNAIHRPTCMSWFCCLLASLGCFCWKPLLPAKSTWCDDRRVEPNVDTWGNWRWFRWDKSSLESSYPGSPDSKQICQQTFLCVFVDLKPFTLTRIWSSMSHKIKFANKTQDKKEHIISLPVPKKSQTKIWFCANTYHESSSEVGASKRRILGSCHGDPWYITTGWWRGVRPRGNRGEPNQPIVVEGWRRKITWRYQKVCMFFLVMGFLVVFL